MLLSAFCSAKPQLLLICLVANFFRDILFVIAFFIRVKMCIFEFYFIKLQCSTMIWLSWQG
uniref:Putative ovule protein n=1 Tax=Solanum chacoense TaxID=4108 RepID=A0A0V0HUI5_SOLCH